MQGESFCKNRMMSGSVLPFLARRCRQVAVILPSQSSRIHAIHTSSRQFADQDAAPSKTFEELLESSPLMKIRRPKGTSVTGRIAHVCNDDLYVDFGGKFEAVVKRPAVKSELVLCC